MHDEEFRRAIEQIKLRAPIEDVVRERVPALRKSGSAWLACCPFHEEKTPSFRVDPRRGTWHCFGACGAGGDQISFVQRLENLSFVDALEILAARTGVPLPRRRSNTAEDAAREQRAGSIQGVLDLALAFYREQLATPEGSRAARYLEGRGLSAATCEAFGVGYAPASGGALVSRLRERGADLAAAEAAGLVRRNDEGRPYDFFRGRLTIPIRDAQGRAVGFGARRLQDDDAAGPKYVNTSETEVFKKGRLVYALDRALPEVRRGGHIVLVEGYTDVMAAHQAGLANVVAVLGTATTEDHAAAIRRTGARRVSLVFDGDEAGRKATWRSLAGLLHLEVEIDVVALGGGIDPCDLIVAQGAAGFRGRLDLARGWFEFALEGLAGKIGAALSREVDSVLDLLARLRKPVHRESLLKELAARIEIPVESLREQFGTRRAGPVAAPIPAPAAPAASLEPGAKRAWEDLVGALLADPSLVPLAREQTAACPERSLAAILSTLVDLDSDLAAEKVDAQAVLNRLADDPARDLVVSLHEHGRTAESPKLLLEGARARLRRIEVERDLAEHRRRIAEREAASAAEQDPEALELSRSAQHVARA